MQKREKEKERNAKKERKQERKRKKNYLLPKTCTFSFTYLNVPGIPQGIQLTLE
jgi:hypothetical protein